MPEPGDCQKRFALIYVNIKPHTVCSSFHLLAVFQNTPAYCICNKIMSFKQAATHMGQDA